MGEKKRVVRSWKGKRWLKLNIFVYGVRGECHDMCGKLHAFFMTWKTPLGMW